MHDVFISYARLDGRAFALRLTESLARRQKEVWLDRQALLPAIEFSSELRLAIDAADALLIVVTERSMSAESVCRVELEHALSRGKRIVPVVPSDWGATPLPASTPPSLRALNILFVSDGEAFERDVDRVVLALDLDLPWVREHTRLLVRATEWLIHQRSADWLLRGEDLSQAETWLERVPSRPQPVPGADATAHELPGSRADAATTPAALHHELIAASRARRAVEHDSGVAARFAALARATLERNPSATPLAARLALESLVRERTAAGYEAAGDALRLLAAPQASIDHPAVVTVLATGVSNRLVSGDRSGTVRLSDVASGERFWERTQGAEITCAGFSADGRRLVAGDASGHAIVYDSASGERLATFAHHERIASASLSPEGRFALTTVGLGVGPAVRGPSIVRVLAVGTGEILAELPHDALATALFHPSFPMSDDEPVIVSTAHEGRLRLLDVRGHELGGGPAGDGPEDTPCHLAADPVRPCFAVVGMGGRVSVTSFGGETRTFTIDVGTNSGSVAFSRGGRFLASLAGDGTVIVWEIDGWTVVARVPAEHASGVMFGRHDDTMAVFSTQGDARIWSIAPLRELTRCSHVSQARFAFAPDANLAILAHEGQQRIWVLSLDGGASWSPHASGTSRSIAIDEASGDVAIGGDRPDPATQWVTAAHPRPGFVACADRWLQPIDAIDTPLGIRCLTWRQGDARQLVTIDDFEIRIGAPGAHATDARHLVKEGIAQTSVSKDGVLVAVCDRQGNCWLTGPDTSSMRLLGAEPSIAAVAISADGTVVAGRSHDGRRALVWETASGALRRELALDGDDPWREFGNTLALSPDGRMMAAAVDRRIDVFDTASGRLIGRSSHQWPPNRVFFDLGGTHLISTSVSSMGDLAAIGDLRVWRTATDRQVVGVILDSPATAAAATREGSFLAVGSQAGDVSLFDLIEGMAIGRLARAGARSLAIRALEFSVDGRCLYVVSGGQVRGHLWVPADVTAELSRRITDEPSQSHWNQVGGGEACRTAPSHA